MQRAALTEKLLDIKREKGWTWKHICDQIGGMSPVMITGALLGHHEADQAAGRQRRQAVRAVERRAGDAQRGADARRAAARCRRPIR